jgi:hypothetical protein
LVINTLVLGTFTLPFMMTVLLDLPFPI